MPKIKKNAVAVKLLSNNNTLFILTFKEDRKVSDKQIIEGIKRFYKSMTYDVDVELIPIGVGFTDIVVKNYPGQGDVLKLGWTLISNVPV